MNIQKIPMRPVICLLLVMLLVSSFFSVSAFADETENDYIELYMLLDWEDHLEVIVSGFCSEFGSPEFTDVFYASFSPRNYIYVDADATGVYLEKSDFQTLITLYNELCDSSIAPISYDFSQTHYYSDFVGDYYRISLILDNFSLDSSPYDFEVIVPVQQTLSSSLVDSVNEDSIFSVIDQVLELLPVALSCIIGFIAIRKGLSFLESILHSA